MEKSRQLNQRTRTQNALCISKITPTKILCIIVAKKGRRSSLLTTVSTVKIKVEWLCGMIQNLFHLNTTKLIVGGGGNLCHKHFSLFLAPSATPELNLMPGKTVSLQCILLAYVKQGHCSAQLQQVSLTWVDEAGAEIREDSHHRIIKESSCDITLTVTFLSPGDKKFRCQATVDEQVQTSVELWVRVPGLYDWSSPGDLCRCWMQRMNNNIYYFLCSTSREGKRINHRARTWRTRYSIILGGWLVLSLIQLFFVKICLTTKMLINNN